MKREFYFAFICLLCTAYTSQVWGQSVSITTSVPSINVVPPSPEASSLGKYGDIPVGLYTGVPDISIPVYTIKLKGIQIPISLSYHSAGIKVDELASNVGLGWTLNGGGVITCSVNGQPDNNGSTGWLDVPSSRYVPVGTNLKLTGWDPGANPSWIFDNEYNFMKDAADGVFDTEPDIYSVNSFSQNFKYYIGQDHITYTMPYQKYGFGDGNGNTYAFNATETATTNYTYSGVFTASPVTNYPNISKYLSGITTAYGETVSYEYEQYNYDFLNQASETRYSTYQGTQFYSDVFDFPTNTRTDSHTYVQGLRLKKIIASNGDTVKFTYGLDRYDIYNSKALTQITVTNAHNPARVIVFDLTYDYYNPPSTTNPPSANNDNCRLRLRTVTEEGKNPYLFDYKGNGLPARLEAAQDHWGYINFGGTGNSLLPIDALHGFTNGVSREPDDLYCQTGILNKITYPTGGTTTFEYEGNVAMVTEPFTESHNETLNAEVDNTVTKSFTIPSNVDLSTEQVYYNAGDDGGGLGSYTDPGNGLHGVVRVKIIGPGGTTQYAGQSSGHVSLSPGNYTLQIETGLSSSTPNVDQTQFNIAITFSTLPATHSINKVTGGCRIKTITSEPITGTPIVKHYEYTKRGDSTLSSGIQGFYPVYNYLYTVYHDSGDQKIFNAQTSSSVSPIGRIQGGAVAYTYVTVYTDAKTKGCTTNSFTYEGGVSGQYGYPFAPVISYDWADGLPIETVDYGYNPTSNQYYPVKKVVNEYNLDFANSFLPNNHVVTGVKIALVKPGILPQLGGGPPTRSPEFLASYFSLYSAWCYPVRKTETFYDAVDSTKKVITEEKYYYDNPLHAEVTREEILKSNGEKYNILLRYPGDVGITTGLSNSIVEKRVMINNGTVDRLVNAQITNYTVSGPFPSSVYNLKSIAPVSPSSIPLFDGSSIDSHFEKRLDYTYNTNKNLVTLLKDTKISVSYQWGYHAEYPIAECKNASNTEFYTENYEEASGVTTGAAHTGTKYSTSASVSWTRPNSRAYVIDYWYLDGTIWKYKQDNYMANTYTMTGGSGYDDVRIYPIDAQMTTYTYDPLVGMTSATDAKGQTTYFEYDPFQRLINIKDQYGNIVKHTDYHYQNQ